MTAVRHTLVFAVLLVVIVGFGYIASLPQNLKLIVLMVAAGLVGFAWVRPRWTIYAWMALSASLWQIWHQNISARLSIHSATALMLGLMLLVKWASNRKWPRIEIWEFMWPLFAIVCMLSAAREVVLISQSPLFLFRYLFLPFVFYLFGREYLANWNEFRILALISVCVGIIMAGIGYYEYTTGHYLWYTTTETAYVNMAFGPYNDPARYGLMQVIAFFMAAFLFRNLKRTAPGFRGKRVFLVLAMVLTAYSSLLSSERALMLAFAVAVAVNLFYLQRRLIAVGMAGVVILIIMFNLELTIDESFIEHKMNVSDASVKRRVAQYISALRIFKEEPLFGVGYRYFSNPRRVDEFVSNFGGVSSRGKLIHNSLLDILASNGLVAFVPYLIFLIALFVVLRRSVGLTRDGPFHTLALTGFVIFIAQQVLNQAFVSVYSEELNTVTFLIFGSVIGNYHRVQAEEAQAKFDGDVMESRALEDLGESAVNPVPDRSAQGNEAV